jgi:hypothetical protein
MHTSSFPPSFFKVLLQLAVFAAPSRAHPTAIIYS